MATKEHHSLEVNMYDTRLLERYLRDGRISLKEYEAHLKKLDDDAANAEYMEIEEETTIEVDSTNAPSDDLTFT
jgi:hypothetical protein